MKRTLLILVVIVLTLSLASFSDAKKRNKRSLNDTGVPIMQKFVCSDLCRGDESIYIYDGITDAEQCAEIGGEMYSVQGWEHLLVCKVMHPKRCREQDGKLGEFHMHFDASHYVDLGCTADMKVGQCRQLLRDSYSTKNTPNKYFMNNVGCKAH